MKTKRTGIQSKLKRNNEKIRDDEIGLAEGAVILLTRTSFLIVQGKGKMCVNTLWKMQ